MILALWVAALAGGIAAALLWPAAGVVLVTAAALAALWRFAVRSPALGIAAAAVGVGVIVGTLAQQPPVLPPAVVRAVAAGVDVATTLEARIVRGPEASGPDGAHARLLLAVTRLDGIETNGVTLSLGVLEGWPREIAPGDTISFQARLHEPPALANPGLPDQALLARAHGIDLVAAVSAPEEIRRTAVGSRVNPRRVAFRLRRAMAGALAARKAGPAAGFLAGVVLGERTAVGQAVEEGFRAAGATHVLSVSGLHLATVAALLFFGLRWAAARWTALALRVSPSIVAAVVSFPVTGLYVLVTGEAIATWRSALMAWMVYGATITRRPLSLPASVAAAALVILVMAPLSVVDVSFQLTFASVIALGAFARRERRQGARGRSSATVVRRMLFWVGRSCAASLVAAAVTAPLVAHHFGEITPLAPLGNLLLVPLVELVVVPAGLTGSLLGAVSAPLGAIPMMVAEWGARAALWMAERFRSAAPVLLVRFPDMLETSALTGAAVLGLLALLRAGDRRRPWMLGALGLLAIASTSLAARDYARRHSQTLRVTFLDVGQGDAALVEGPGGSVTLVDGGGTYDGSFDPGERVIEPFLRTRGISRLDLVVLSHPHPDHMNGLRRVLARFEVGALWTSGDDGKNPAYHELVSLARARAVPMPRPARWEAGPVVAEPLGPWLGDEIAPPPGATVNDASLVVRVAFAGRALLFPGDLEGAGEDELVGRAAAGASIASDVVKVPHHGSRTSSTVDLLDAVGPTLAVISLGRNNRFHFPAPEVLARYAQRGARVLRTDRDGAVSVTISAGGGIRATCARGCR